MHNESETWVLYNRLAALRADRGASRKDLAQTVGVHPQTIGFIERGDYGPSLELAFRIASFFDAPVDTVFSMEPFRSLASELAAKGLDHVD